jgi:hypothetical protein
VGRGAAEAVEQLRAATEALPDDELRGAADTGRANVAALIARGVDLEATLEKWSAANAGTRWFRASGGNVVRVREDVATQSSGPGARLELLGDHAGAAKRFVAQHLAAGGFKNLYLEGIDPPWLLRGIAEALPRQKDGSWTRLVLVQADAMELLDGLALADVREVLSQERLSVIVGPDTGAGLQRWLRARFESQVAGPCVPLNSVRTRLAPTLESTVRAAEDDQLREHERLSRDVRA